MRLRVLVPLLVLTTVDYALWDWSIADGHDIVSLVAGLTLLPLAVVSLGGIVLTVARVLGTLLGSSPRTGRAPHGDGATELQQHSPVSERDSSSGRLAA